MINKISSCGRITTEVKWPLVKLNEACSLNMGQSPDSSGYNDEGKGLPFYQGNADFGTLTPVTRLFCNNPTKIAHAGDILLSVRAPIGAVNIANQTCCIGRGLAALTAYRDVDVKFLYYAIKSKHGEFNAKGTGSTFKAINKKALYETRIPLPALAEQKNIANILDNVSNLISLCKKQIMQLDLLVKSRFIEMFGDVSCNDKGWKIAKMSEISTSRLGKMLDAKKQTGQCSFPYLANINVRWFGFDFSSLRQMDFNEADQQEFSLLKGDLLVCEGGEVGRCAVWDNEISPCFYQKALHRIRCDFKKILPEYLAWWFKCNCDKEAFENVAGAKATIAHLPGVKLKNLNVATPPISLQQDFVTFLRELDKSKFTIRKSLEKLETLYRALLQEYFG